MSNLYEYTKRELATMIKEQAMSTCEDALMNIEMLELELWSRENNIELLELKL